MTIVLIVKLNMQRRNVDLTKCSLCGMKFKETDLLFNERQRAHEIWHSPTKRKRNTVMGKVIWLD